MPDLTIPLIAATVFTVGGYGILRAERYAKGIGEGLAAVFMLCTVLVAVEAAVNFANGLHPHPAPSVRVSVPPTTEMSYAPPPAVAWLD